MVHNDRARCPDAGHVIGGGHARRRGSSRGTVIALRRDVPVALVIGADLGGPSIVAVALSPWFRVETASALVSVLSEVELDDLALVAVGPSAWDSRHGGALHTLRACHPKCRVLLLDPRADVHVTLAQVAGLFPEQTGRRVFGRYVRRAISEIGTNLSARITLAHVAGVVGISASHLAQRFSIETRVRFKDFVIRARLDAAKRLLRETDASLAIVAERAGFYDASHVTRLFRRGFGCMRGAYRRCLSAGPRRSCAPALCRLRPMSALQSP